MDMSMNAPDTDTYQYQDTAHTAEDSDVAHDATTNISENEGEEAIITQFCDVTGSERGSARHFLEVRTVSVLRTESFTLLSGLRI